jgi:hypothetical protein
MFFLKSCSIDSRSAFICAAMSLCDLRSCNIERTILIQAKSRDRSEIGRNTNSNMEKNTSFGNAQL